MSPRGPARFAFWATLLCLAVSLGLLPLGFMFGTSAVAWGLAGFWMMSVVGIAGGAWLVDGHGSTGPHFPMALATCILARLAVAAVGAAAATTRGIEAVYAVLAGLVASYVPVQVFETSWFLARNKLQG